MGSGRSADNRIGESSSFLPNSVVRWIITWSCAALAALA